MRPHAIGVHHPPPLPQALAPQDLRPKKEVFSLEPLPLAEEKRKVDPDGSRPHGQPGDSPQPKAEARDPEAEAAPAPSVDPKVHLSVYDRSGSLRSGQSDSGQEFNVSA